MSRTAIDNDHVRIGAQHIVLDVASRHRLRLDQLIGRSRQREYCKARREAYSELRAFGLSLPQIAWMFQRDHTTILSALQGEEAA